MRPLDCRYRSERNTIQRTRHIDVCEEYCDIRIGLQQGQCLLPIAGLKNLKPRIGEKLDPKLSNKLIVLDDKDGDGRPARGVDGRRLD